MLSSFKRRFVLGLPLLLALFFSSAAMSADEGDLYMEGRFAFGGSGASRLEFGGVVGYLPWNELGLGVFMEQHFSRSLDTTDESAFRAGGEARWFQEPFEIAASFGWLGQSNRDGTSSQEPALGVEGVYLLALTPSLSALVRFNFLFLDELGVLFYSGAGFRILF